MFKQIEVDARYKIVGAHQLFADWIGTVAVCKRVVNGMYEMHANNAFIYCAASDLRSAKKMSCHT